MNIKTIKRVFKALEREVKAEADVVPAMRRLMAMCAEAHPSRIWKAVLGLELADDAAALSRWAAQVLKKEPPPSSINGYWFGIFDTGTPEEGVTGCQLYIAGSDRFDPKDESVDWACDPAWFPERRYAKSSVLSKVYRVVDRADTLADAAELARYFVPLAFAAMATVEICKTVPLELLLRDCERRAVVVGFDSGDFVRLNDVVAKPRAASRRPRR